MVENPDVAPLNGGELDLRGGFSANSTPGGQVSDVPRNLDDWMLVAKALSGGSGFGFRGVGTARTEVEVRLRPMRAWRPMNEEAVIDGGAVDG